MTSFNSSTHIYKNFTFPAIVFRMIVTALLFISVSFILESPICASNNDDIQIKRLVHFLAMGTGTTTGTYYPLGLAFARLWTGQIPSLDVMAHSTMGSVENIELLRKGELNLAIAQGDTVLAAYEGTGIFEGNPYHELRVIMSLYPEVVQIIVPADSNVKDIRDLKGLSVIVGAHGSGNALTSMELMKVLGILETDFTPVFKSYDEALKAMSQGEYDAAIIIAGIPTKVIVELNERLDFRFLSFSSEDIETISQKLPYLSGLDIPAKAYGMKKDVQTLALMAMLICDKSLDGDLIKEMLDSTITHLVQLEKSHERAGDITVKSMKSGVPDNLLHDSCNIWHRTKH